MPPAVLGEVLGFWSSTNEYPAIGELPAVAAPHVNDGFADEYQIVWLGWLGEARFGTVPGGVAAAAMLTPTTRQASQASPVRSSTLRYFRVATRVMASSACDKGGVVGRPVLILLVAEYRTAKEESLWDIRLAGW